MRVESHRQQCTYYPETTYQRRDVRKADDARYPMMDEVTVATIERTQGRAVCTTEGEPPKQDEGGGLLSGIGGVFSKFGERCMAAVVSITSGIFSFIRGIMGITGDDPPSPSKTLHGAVHGTLMLGAKTVSGLQTMAYLEPSGRRLHDEEMRLARRIFGSSVVLDAVRIKEGSAGAFSVNNRPFTLGNAIYTKGRKADASLFIHEMVHVWQNQRGGPDYALKALAAQAGDGYNWEKAVAEGKSWAKMNVEQQAQLIEDALDAGFFDGQVEEEASHRFVQNGVDHSNPLRQALRELRAR
ncbi:MAG: DUF4157 domain-containing protein [Polyangiaceae bacterium]|nr:DUF4157 domain-containing protein [Polyangiaceae bacterium]